MRVVLLGAVQSTEVALQTLVQCSQPPVELVTLSAKRSDRHSDYVDLVRTGASLDVPVTSVASARAGGLETVLKERKADLLLVIGWSEILPAAVLDASDAGAIGYHPSALPELRGRGVIPWTVLLERSETAGTLFWLNREADDGDVAYQRRFAVDHRETATTLYSKHMDALRAMLEEFCKVGSPEGIPRLTQEGSRSYCSQRRPVDGLIDWTNNARDIDRLIRASTRPYPGARGFRAKDQTEAVIWESTPLVEESLHGLPGQVVAHDGDRPLVTCGQGVLRIDEASEVDGKPLSLRIQDRFMPHSLALQEWAQLRPL